MKQIVHREAPVMRPGGREGRREGGREIEEHYIELFSSTLTYLNQFFLWTYLLIANIVGKCLQSKNPENWALASRNSDKMQ